MIDRSHDLPITRQARILNVSRGSVYYRPRPASAADLALMRRMDELHLEFPFAGSRMLRDLLTAEGFQTGRRHVSTLMKRMGIQAIYRKPNTSKPAPGHKIYPYLLRDLPVTRPNQVWAMDITYVPMARGFVSLAAVIDWFSRRVLAWRLSITMEAGFCVEAVEEALARHGKPEIFNTDQGSQFTSAAFTGLLIDNAIAIRYRGDRQHFSALAIGSDCQRVRSAQGHTACGGGLRPALIAAPRAGQDGRRSGRRGHRAGIEQRNRVIRGW
jgi:putative transposase